jgi:HPt (histidine-containing phosphotransfer) domain-containing protein
MDQDAFNFAIFRELQETTGADFVTELVRSFLEEAPQMRKTLSDACTARDAVTFKRAAHSIKTNANTFGALKLSGMARDLELGGLPQPGQASTQALDRLTEAFQQAEQILQSTCNA